MEIGDEKYPFEKFDIGEEIEKKVISSIAATANHIVLGTEDGYLYSYELAKDENTQ